MVERKIIDIRAFSLKPTVCVSYIVTNDIENKITFANNVKFWVKEERMNDREILYDVDIFIKNIFNYQGRKRNESINEQEIFRMYQKLFAKKKWLNYKLRTQKFKMEKLASMRKPFRDFVEVSQEFLEEQIQKTYTERKG